MQQRADVTQREWRGRTYWFVSEAEAYRRLAAALPKEGDVVWELGAATGAATALAAQAAQEVVAVEKAAEKLEKLAAVAEAHANVRVVEADALAKPELPEGARADLLLVDIGGDAPPWRTMQAADSWADSLACVRVVVRNTAMAELLAGRPPSPANPPVARASSPCGTTLPASDPSLLVQPVLDVVSRDTARQMVEGLREGGFTARQRLAEGLVALGPAAIRPLAGLVTDMEASPAARRAAAETLKQVTDRVERETQRALRHRSPALEWALGVTDGETAGAELAAAERKGKTPSGHALIRLLGHPDELVSALGKQALKEHGEEAARKLVLAAAEDKAFVSPTVTALDALATVKAVTAECAVEWYLESGGRREAPWRLAAATLGVAERQWAAEVLEEVAKRREELPVEPLQRLTRAAQGKPRGKEALRALEELVRLEAPVPMLASAAGLSPHPWMREVGEVLAEAVAEEDE